jgi:FixJ family two-component response regulator
MSGPELRDALRRRGSDSPVIFITAHEIDKMEQDLGMEPVLFKPIEADVLVRAIDAAITPSSGRPRRAKVARR